MKYAEAMGINTTKYKVLAFIIGAFCAGITGALYSSYFYYIKPDLFGFLKSVDILVIVVLGGLGVFPVLFCCCFIGRCVYFFQSFPEIRMILYALILVIIMIFRPQGLLGSKEISISMFNRMGKLFAFGKGEK